MKVSPAGSKTGRKGGPKIGPKADSSPDSDVVHSPYPEAFAVGELVVRAAQRRRRPARVSRVALLYFDRPEYWEPAAAQADASALGGVNLRLRFEGAASPWRCGALFLRIAFDDPRVRTVDARAAATDSNAADAVLISGLGSPAVGWYVEGAGGDTDSWEMTVRVSLEVPADVDELVGTLTAEAPLVRAGLPPGRRAHARMSALEEFVVPLPEERLARPPAEPSTGGALGALPAAAKEGGPSVRLCIAVDIERYSRFHTPEAVRAQERLLEILTRACGHAGIRGDQAETQAAGDGQFVVFAPGLDESVVIPALVHGVELVLTEVNNDLNERARLRLRVALHRGYLTRGPNGYAGVSSIAVHRILDSPPARRALADHPRADFALIVPDSLYSDVIVHGYGLLRPDRFAPVDVDVPAKGFRERAWVYVPGDA